MSRTTITLAALLIATATASAEPQSRTFYDSSGGEVGRAERHGDTTTFSNSLGQQTGRAERRGDETIFFNERGERVGTERRRRSGGR
jgi:hypothetical protein